jgi:hypothetical protein
MNRHLPGHDWLAIVRQHGTTEFGKAFALPTLDASVLSSPSVGIQAIAAFFAATSSGMYETIEFTHETIDGLKTYLEWQGTTFGKRVLQVLMQEKQDRLTVTGVSANSVNSVTHVET